MIERDPLSVVIVSYESAAELPPCLDSVLVACRPSDEVIVIDNASADASAVIARTMAPRVTVLVNDRNVGFARAANQGVRQARHPLCMLLNPDTVISSDAIERLVACLDAQSVDAIVGPRLSNTDGSHQRSAFRFPTPEVLLIEQLNLARRWPGFVEASDPTGEVVDWLKGACLLGRTSVMQRLGPFDDRFFMFGEDVDLGLRLRQAGGRSVFCPSATIAHYGGRSTQRFERQMTLEFVRSTYRLYRLHGWDERLPLASAVIRSTATLKAVRAIWVGGISLILGRRSTWMRQRRLIGTFARMAMLPTRDPVPTRTPRATPAGGEDALDGIMRTPPEERLTR